MDEEDRPNEEEAAEAYKEYLWEREMKHLEHINEQKRVSADMKRKELKEAA
jgi:cation transport regulator ChaC